MAIPTYFNVNPLSGTGSASLSVQGDVHTGRLERGGTVAILADGVAAPHNVQVRQKPEDEFISADESTIFIANDSDGFLISGKANAGRLSFGITGDVNVDLSSAYLEVNGVYAPVSTTIAGDPGADARYLFVIKFKVSENVSVGNKESVVTISGDTSSTTVTLTQGSAGPYMSISTTEVVLNTNGDEESASVLSNANWALS